MISIIIPTLNEENYLPLLFESIKKQRFFDYEIIVADAGSKDKTKKIAKKYKARIIKGGLPGKARNEGAKVAKGELLFFLDADVVLPDKFFKKILTEFNKKKLDIAGFRLVPLPKKIISFFIYNIFYNWPIIALEKILPHAATGILVKKSIFERLGGFDESIKLAEDHDFARRAAKIGKFRIIRSDKIYSSDRRVRKDGWLNIGLKFFLCDLHMIFLGPVRSDVFKYRFDHYERIKNK